MDGDLTEKIRRFLSDPGAAEKIAAVAGTLAPQAGQPAASPPAPDSPPAELPRPAAAMPLSGGHTALIAALRPLIREDKRPKIDALSRAMTVATLFAGLKKS